MVARFRDPDGPRVLLCTGLGGEGRNFQHCHVLVNYDLAWSPAAIEQRIGRIDRIGQVSEVRIYAFRPEGTLAARVLDVLDAGVGVFTEPVGGLDPVLESVEADLLALATRGSDAGWEKMTRELAARVSTARAEVARAYDPLLDLRSCDLAAVRALAERGAQRLGARIPAGAEAVGALGAVATHLEKRMEIVTIESARGAAPRRNAGARGGADGRPRRRASRRRARSAARFGEARSGAGAGRRAAGGVRAGSRAGAAHR